MNLWDKIRERYPLCGYTNPCVDQLPLWTWCLLKHCLKPCWVQPLNYPPLEGGRREDEFWITEVQLERAEEWKS